VKILLCVDVMNWAWAHKARAIQKYLKNDFEKIDIIRSNTVKNNKHIFKEYNHIHWFGWLEGRLWCQKYRGTSAGVSSHNYLYKHSELAKSVMPKYGALTCTSKILYDELKKKKLNKHIYLCQNGVDEQMFQPAPVKHDKFVVGWMGQPTHGNFSGQQLDMHGYEHVLLPLVESLKENKNIEFRIMAKTFKNAVSHSEMPRWYNGLDLFLHTGFGTGTPNGVFEAMACGVPCISTAIGAAPEVIEDGENGWCCGRFYSKGDARDIVDWIRLKILLWEPRIDELRTMGQNARKTIEESWTWKERARAWIKPFKNHAKQL
jgi:glycosyltransferase involved in cell wall biosynthesis